MFLNDKRDGKELQVRPQQSKLSVLRYFFDSLHLLAKLKNR